MQRGTMDWRKALGKVIEGFWLYHNEIYGLSPPPPPSILIGSQFAIVPL